MAQLSAMLSTLVAQFEMLNAMLKNYGIEIMIDEVKLRSGRCENCSEFIMVVKFDDKFVHEQFIAEMKKQYGSSGSSAQVPATQDIVEESSNDM